MNYPYGEGMSLSKWNEGTKHLLEQPPSLSKWLRYLAWQWDYMRAHRVRLCTLHLLWYGIKHFNFIWSHPRGFDG